MVEATEFSGGGDIEGGGPKGHFKVTRSDGTHYWRRSPKAKKAGVKHHKSMTRTKKRKSMYSAHVKTFAQTLGISYKDAQKHPRTKETYLEMKTQGRPGFLDEI